MIFDADRLKLFINYSLHIISHKLCIINLCNYWKPSNDVIVIAVILLWQHAFFVSAVVAGHVRQTTATEPSEAEHRYRNTLT